MRDRYDTVRSELDLMLSGRSRLTMSTVAREVGLNKATVCRFRKGVYTGNNEMVALKIADWIGSKRIAEQQIAGALRQMWLVRTSPDRIRIVRTRRALDKTLQDFPDSHVVTMWLGAEPSDLYFSE